MPDDKHQWDENDSGLWCQVCGHHIAAPWNMDDDYEPPDICPQCGFPDELDPEKI